MPITYYAVFRLKNRQEVGKLAEYLEQNLKPPHTFDAGLEYISVTSPTKDGAHKCAVWLANNNPLGRKLKYKIRGINDKGQLVYLSISKKKKWRAKQGVA